MKRLCEMKTLYYIENAQQIARAHVSLAGLGGNSPSRQKGLHVCTSLLKDSFFSLSSVCESVKQTSAQSSNENEGELGIQNTQ